MNRLRLALHALLRGRLPESDPVTRVTEAPAESPPPAPGPVVPEAVVPEAVVPEAVVPEAATDRLIDLRDNVLIASDTIEGDGRAALASVARQLAEVLRLTGIETFDDDGPFDDLRHHIAGTVPTGDPALEHVIARSVRSGCWRNGTLLRRQQVLVYELRDAGDG